jgi:NAD(P)H-flavin reductase
VKLNLKNFVSRCEKEGHIYQPMPEWLAKDFPEDDNRYCCLCGKKEIAKIVKEVFK